MRFRCSPVVAPKRSPLMLTLSAIGLSLSLSALLFIAPALVSAEDATLDTPATSDEEPTPILKTSADRKEMGDNEMLLRALALDVSGYPEAAKITEATQSAESAFALIQNSPNLLVHMETIRQAYLSFGQDPNQRQTFMKQLNARYVKNNADPICFFDFGYAELVFDANKNGLFFLRKANDSLALPYTSIAYGLAQIDADRIFEHAAKHEITPRKQDAAYKLKDALLFNKSDPQPGVWENYIRIIEALKAYPGFDSLTHEDVTSLIIPYGSSSLGALAGVDQESVEKLALKKPEAISTFDPKSVSCDIQPARPDIATLKKSRPHDLNHDGQFDTLNFYSQGPNKPFLFQAQEGTTQTVLAQFNSYSQSLVEDLDGDGQDELVVRQFEHTIKNPLEVYRWNGQCFVKDTQVAKLFE